MATSSLRKQLGAYYTDSGIAAILCRWAIRSASDCVIDPSCGDGVFLLEAAARLEALGGHAQVTGVDVSAEAVKSAATLLPSARLVTSDFFEVSRDRIGSFDCVVGNPPFIRYQTFSGDARTRALNVAHERGVKLTQLASSWAPFVVHATSLLRPGGRLAMVIPAEIGHAAYAKDVLSYLLRHFGSLQLAFFREKLFPELSQGTVLCFADAFGSTATHLTVSTHRSGETFPDALAVERIPVEKLDAIRFRLARFLLPPNVREFYEWLSKHSDVRSLNDIADISLGYVTGDNHFFHVSECEAEELEIPTRFLSPSVGSLSRFAGVRFTKTDWLASAARGDKAYLIAVKNSERRIDGLRKWLNRGCKQGTDEKFKCRIREPWYSVPNVSAPGLFLTYMSGRCPKLIVNEAQAVCPNTLHRVEPKGKRSGNAIAVGWLSSFTELSCEIEGHAMGGGMLKLEPSEARRVKVPVIPGLHASVNRVEACLRSARPDSAQEIADYLTLIKGLNLPAGRVEDLRAAAHQLRKWRMGKGE